MRSFFASSETPSPALSTKPAKADVHGPVLILILDEPGFLHRTGDPGARSSNNETVRGLTGDHHAMGCKIIAVMVVDLKAVSVTLIDQFCSIKGICLGLLSRTHG